MVMTECMGDLDLEHEIMKETGFLRWLMHWI